MSSRPSKSKSIVASLEDEEKTRQFRGSAR